MFLANKSKTVRKQWQARSQRHRERAQLKIKQFLKTNIFLETWAPPTGMLTIGTEIQGRVSK